MPRRRQYEAVGADAAFIVYRRLVIMDIERKKEKNFYRCFTNATMAELQEHLLNAKTREEKAFYRALLNLKLQLQQEKVVGKDLV